MKINIIKTLSIAILVGAIALPSFTFAQTITADGQGVTGATINSDAPIAAGQNTTGASENTSAPAAAGQNTTGASTGTSAPIAAGQNVTGASPSPAPSPAAAGQNTTGASGSVPAAAGQNTTGATASPSPTPAAAAGQNTTGATTNPTTPPATNGGGSTSVGGGSSFSSGGGSGSYLPLLTNIGECNYLTAYMKIDKINPPIEVTKLQNFLKNNEGMNVNVTGTFDELTLQAVNAFQVKYRADVLTPWGISNPTGFVYYTTSKKINELYCKRNFALTASQIREIESYRTAIQNGTRPATGDVGIKNSTNGSALANATSTKSNNTSYSTTSPYSDTQVAAVGKISVFTKIWNFIKRIFGR